MFRRIPCPWQAWNTVGHPSLCGFHQGVCAPGRGGGGCVVDQGSIRMPSDHARWGFACKVTTFSNTIAGKLFLCQQLCAPVGAQGEGPLMAHSKGHPSHPARSQQGSDLCSLCMQQESNQGQGCPFNCPYITVTSVTQ